MPRTFRVRDIALQAGVSETTVDRVLNGRPGVRATTVDEVHRAVADLERQRTQLRLTGRTFVVDVVVDAPERFTTAVREALERTLPVLRPAVLRCRFAFSDAASPAEVAGRLREAARRGSHGVVLKAPDSPEVVDAVARLRARGVPVVTLVTDLPGSARVAYAGIDNRAAGATAAYLVGRWGGGGRRSVLLARGRSTFEGEDARCSGFLGTLREGFPGVRVHQVREDERPGAALGDLVRAALRADPELDAVYSAYASGGSAQVPRAFAAEGRHCGFFLVHDLHPEHEQLLRTGGVDVVLHHDLAGDLRRACHALLQARGELPGAPQSWSSSVQVVTPHNPPVPLPLG
ncbi:LacI family DNA-binding transcriptional regulator [Kineococcus terrestris]|uniref:LacI family DNA-binding transcriptional regulator n=1 Tax=Kineococcus terrestris TaxID=2044856 RepID=UPI0034DAFAEB